MKRKVTVLLTLMLLIGSTAGWPSSAAAQGAYGAGVRYFTATGHNVQGEFLAFFDRYGGEAIFGLPRTEEFVENGMRVQYFQRAKMEYHPFNPELYKVQLALLGDLLGYRTPGIPPSRIPPANHPQRRYYPQTGHTVSYGFLEFFDTHGGLNVFGYPISEPVMENGRVVQYFQRAKMEWHPENSFGYQIVLLNLGDEYIARMGVPWSYLERAAPITEPAIAPQALIPGAIPGVDGGQSPPTVIGPPPRDDFTAFSVSVSLKYPITGQGGSQTVYVRAIDSNGQGVGNANVAVIVHFRSGDRLFTADPTDASGSSSLTFGIGYQPPGYTVLVEVRVTYSGRTVTSQTSFVPWW